MSLTLPLVFGHRGAKAIELENTIKSFQYACQSNIAGIELDVMLSKDGVAMVFHDETLDRLCETKGRLENFTAQELLSFPLLNGAKIPTLEQVLDALKDYQGVLNIEIKPSNTHLCQKTAQETCKIVKKKGFDKPQKLFFSSFQYECLKETMKILPEIKRGVLVEESSVHWQEAAQEIKAYSINYDATLLTPALIKEIKQKGYHLLAYTVNDTKQAKELYSQGVEGFFCDNPVKIKTFLERGATSFAQ